MADGKKDLRPQGSYRTSAQLNMYTLLYLTGLPSCMMSYKGRPRRTHIACTGGPRRWPVIA